MWRELPCRRRCSSTLLWATGRGCSPVEPACSCSCWGGSVFSWSCCQLGVMVLLFARRLLLDTATVDAPGSDARLLADTPCCHAPGGRWTLDTAVSIQCAAAAADSASPLSTRWIRAMLLLLSRRAAVDVASVHVRLSVGRGCVSLLADCAGMRLVVSGRG